jgi:type IV pilus assembly protein PilY1
MRQSDLAVKTYTVDVDKVTNGQGPGWTAVLKSIAKVSDGKYFDVTSSGDEIAKALKSIFSDIQAVDSAFASVSLPASVNTEGRYLNQIFIGLFRPDGDSQPKWPGNVKQYRVATVNGELTTADARIPAQSAIGDDGYFSQCARSYWTPSSTDSYWEFDPSGSCLEVAGAAGSNSPDGNIVEKGGHAYILRNSSSRNMKTCSSSACTALAAFDNRVITPELLGVTTTDEREAIIPWSLGTYNEY